MSKRPQYAEIKVNCSQKFYENAVAGTIATRGQVNSKQMKPYVPQSYLSQQPLLGIHIIREIELTSQHERFDYDNAHNSYFIQQKNDIEFGRIRVSTLPCTCKFFRVNPDPKLVVSDLQEGLTNNGDGEYKRNVNHELYFTDIQPKAFLPQNPPNPVITDKAIFDFNDENLEFVVNANSITNIARGLETRTMNRKTGCPINETEFRKMIKPIYKLLWDSELKHLVENYDRDDVMCSEWHMALPKSWSADMTEAFIDKLEEEKEYYVKNKFLETEVFIKVELEKNGKDGDPRIICNVNPIHNLLEALLIRPIDFFMKNKSQATIKGMAPMDVLRRASHKIREHDHKYFLMSDGSRFESS